VLVAVLIVVSTLFLLALSNRLLGPGARPECPFCGSRVSKHAKSCPWSHREH
jgi:hypothetical protein